MRLKKNEDFNYTDMGFIVVVHKLALKLARLLMISKLTYNIDIGLLLGE
jgi:hypothetical protein